MVIATFRATAALALTLFALLACAGSALAAAGAMQLGFSDNAFVTAKGPEVMDLAIKSGGRLVRLNCAWSVVARARPADEQNPADPAYDFAALDAAVRAAIARGLRPFILIGAAPPWAEGPGRPAIGKEDGAQANVAPGAWKPDAAAFGRFAAAVASRYSGTFRAAAGDQPLPRVRDFQAWNEPNLNTYLAPQWERAGSGYRAYAPDHYRTMLNAFSSAVKRVRNDNFVITAGTAPYGNPAGEWRRRPLAFWRDALCVRAKCANPARFDALAHHPYGSPLDDSFNADDLPILGVRRLMALLRGAENLGRVSKRDHPLWITELGIETSPPDPDGVSLAAQENYLQLSLYRLWSAGVRSVAWFQVIDADQGDGYSSTVQAGLYLKSGKAKRAAKAFAFPFATDPDRPGIYWGIAPASGKVRIERRARGRWVLVRELSVGTGRTFTGRGPWPSGTLLRARQGAHVSLSWRAL